METINQCDGCRAGKPFVKILNGRFEVIPEGTTHAMGSLEPGGYADLMACQKHKYESDEVRIKKLLRAWVEFYLFGNGRQWRERHGNALGEDFAWLYTHHSFDRPVGRLLELTRAFIDFDHPEKPPPRTE